MLRPEPAPGPSRRAYAGLGAPRTGSVGCRGQSPDRPYVTTRSPEEDAVRNATAIGLVVLLVIIIGAAAYQVLLATS